MLSKKTIFILTFTFIAKFLQGQSEFQLQDFHPVSPAAYQFSKYDELPVSEYSGIPNVSIPLYTIQVDGISIPLNLSYHAGGIKVSEDAGWVGLGWDIPLGSIVQEVHDIDDLSGATLIQPDYQNTQSLPPTWLPFYCAWNTPVGCGEPGGSYSNPYPIYSGPYWYAYAVATDYYMPINGNFANQYTGTGIANEGQDPLYDSDPDIFTANFLGHSIKFALNFKTNQWVVLNKPGYTVSRNGNTFQIIDPDGEQFFFGQYSADSILSVNTAYAQYGNWIGTPATGASRVWMVTQIITKHQRQITLNYTQTPYNDLYPSYSQRWDSAIVTSETEINEQITGVQYPHGLTSGLYSGISQSLTSGQESRLYLQSIVFPSGEADFFNSSRNDLLGGLKLDSIHVKNQAQNIFRSFYLTYNYLNSSSIGGNAYSPNSTTIANEYANIINLRLNLLSLADNSGQVYNFSYNTTPLPAKNSIAQDIWGYYNGQLNNTSLIPNPSRFVSSPAGTNNLLSGNTLIGNGNNTSASYYYCQAGILTKIQYPTGGIDSFEYALNQFSNYWIPDSANSNNTLTSGNGLRVKAIDYYTTPSMLAKRSLYSYNGGIALFPLLLYRNYQPTSIVLVSSSPIIMYNLINYNVFEISAKGFFSTNALGSGSGVGYSQVTRQDVNNSGAPNGSTQTNFYNNADYVYNSGVNATNVAVEMPATKNTAYPENGKIQSELTFDNNGNLLKQVVYSYGNNLFTTLYGVKVFPCGSYVWDPGGWQPIPQTLLAFYPIFDYESLLTGKTTTEYANGNSLVTTEGFGFDPYDQLNIHTVVTPAFYSMDHIEHTGSTLTYYTDAASQALLQNAHRYTDILMEEKWQGPYAYQNEPVSSYYKHYQSVNNVPAESYVTVNKNLLVQTPLTDTITYDSYDGFINPMQYTSQHTRNCILWDYNGTYPIAEASNTIISNVAYTSFEADGSGNWVIPSVNRDATTALTGSHCYNLSNGSINSGTLSSATTYIVSYWSQTGSQYSVSGTASVLQGKTISINGSSWTYFEHTVTGVSSVTVTGSADIDELRLYPKGALMKTYTYTPLVGISTGCDEDNRATYYFYDAAARLAYIKDQDGNILKTYKYHYYSQAN